MKKQQSGCGSGSVKGFSTGSLAAFTFMGKCMKKFSFGILLFIALSSSAHALTGNDYERLSKNLKVMWIMGVTEGLTFAKTPSSDEQEKFGNCMSNLEWQQIKAIFERSLESAPEIWHFPAALKFQRTFRMYCGLSE
jgi:hypothetical protein